MRLAAMIVIVFSALPASAGERKPTVVSLDSCADQLVLALADDDQILALSRSATGPFSYYLERAERFPVHQGTPEEILLLNPDVVLSTGAGDPGLTEILEELGITVMKTGLPETIGEAIEGLKEAGHALNQDASAARLASSTEQALSVLESETGNPVSAVYMSPSGITTGSGTFLDEVMRLAGLGNLVAEQGVRGWSSFDVESFISLHPDVLVTSFFDSKVGNAESWRFAEHPAVREAMGKVEIVDVPSKFLSCPAWYAVEGAAYIRGQMKEAGRHASGQ